VVFQRYSVFPHLSVLDNVAIGLELPSSPLLGRLFGARKREAREQAAQMLEKVGLATRWINTRRSSPAGCSSGWRSPRPS
jgi:ABC-type polar amino acid transport system ATPase subunit